MHIKRSYTIIRLRQRPKRLVRRNPRPIFFCARHVKASFWPPTILVFEYRRSVQGIKPLLVSPTHTYSKRHYSEHLLTEHAAAACCYPAILLSYSPRERLASIRSFRLVTHQPSRRWRTAPLHQRNDKKKQKTHTTHQQWNRYDNALTTNIRENDGTLIVVHGRTRIWP